MIRGTTPTHTFVLPFNTSLVSSARISYAQRGNVLLKKETPACTLEANTNTISVTLSQEDTLLFNSGLYVDIQLRVLTTDGVALSTDIITKSVGECLDGGVIA